ncbi:hypothetical protein sos41_14980 [Alphaproteobacteria bacterium SO-S41]|nr:hypothetical protein sos41_14980 [Alphaproteobacteria bacterium SO-S41]
MTDMTRRSLVGAGALGALAATSVASAADGENVAQIADLGSLRKRVSDAEEIIYVQAADGAGEGGGLFRLDALDTSSPDDGGIIVVDERGRRWKRLFDGSIKAEWFGAQALERAVSSAVARGTHLTFGPQTHKVATDIELPAGRVYAFAPGARLEIAAGATVTIRGVLSAADAPLFFGEGRVVGIRDVAPEWWGAIGDGQGDQAAALQAAFESVAQSQDSDGDVQRVRLSGNYRVASTIHAVASAAVNLRVGGGGTVFGGARLTAAATFDGDIALQVRGQAEGELLAIADWGLTDFAIVGEAGTNCKIGLKIGEGERSLIGLQKSRVTGVHVSGFAICWLITNARLIKFENCSGWADSVADGIALSITLESVDFTGDIEFDSCQYVAQMETGRSVTVAHGQNYDLKSGGGQLKGIYFSNCTFYNGEFFFEIYAQDGAVVGDIWLDKCQFDGFGKTRLRIGAETRASIENLRVTNCYFRGANAGFFAVLADIAKDGIVRSVHLSDNWIANCLTRAVMFRGIENLVFDQNSFVECADQESVVYIDTSSPWQANHNTLVQAASAVAPHFITIQETSAPDGIAIGNIADEKAAPAGALDDRRQRYTVRLSKDISIVDGQVGIGIATPSFPLQVIGAIGLSPGPSVTPQIPGEIVFELTSDTSITLKVKGMDGQVRSAVLKLE